MLFQRMPVFRAMLVFYAMLARELPYTILAQILQCWRRKTVVPFTWQFTCRFNCGNFSNNNKALLHMCKWSIWPKWNLHRSEFHYTRSHVNVDNEVTTPKWNFTPKWTQTSLESQTAFEKSFRLHGNLHEDFTAATFQTIAKLYYTSYI